MMAAAIAALGERLAAAASSVGRQGANEKFLALEILKRASVLSKMQNVLWDVLQTPGGSDKVPVHLRILHDMKALLQENKIRKR